MASPLDHRRRRAVREFSGRRVCPMEAAGIEFAGRPGNTTSAIIDVVIAREGWLPVFGGCLSSNADPAWGCARRRVYLHVAPGDSKQRCR